MRKITIISLVLVGIIVATAVLAQSFSTGSSTNQSATTNSTINTGNQATISVSPSILSTIKTITNKDANIRLIEIKDDLITIDYQESTKILGLFPAKFKLRVITDTDKKQVNLTRPWWTIFGNTRVGKLLKDIRTSLEPIQSGSTLSQQVKVVQTISGVLRKAN